LKIKNVIEIEYRQSLLDGRRVSSLDVGSSHFYTITDAQMKNQSAYGNYLFSNGRRTSQYRNVSFQTNLPVLQFRPFCYSVIRQSLFHDLDRRRIDVK